MDENKYQEEVFEEQEQPRFFRMKSANQWMREADSQPIQKHLFGDLWFENEASVLFADTNAGKSILAVQIADSVSRGVSIPPLLFDAGAKTAILDNITYLGEELEKSKGALPLMKRLKEIKKRHNFSFLILAHTPKRSATRPITKNDLNGSMMIMNFVDSAFAIGTSRQGKDVRYIKQLKVRNAQLTYGTESVLTATIEKSGNFLRFVFGDVSKEVEHLEKADPMEKEEKLELIRDLYSDHKSAREIARELDISHTQVNRLLKEMFNDGTLNRRGTGTVPDVTGVPDVPPVPQVSTVSTPASSKPKRKRKTNGNSGT